MSIIPQPQPNLNLSPLSLSQNSPSIYYFRQRPDFIDFFGARPRISLCLNARLAHDFGGQDSRRLASDDYRMEAALAHLLLHQLPRLAQPQLSASPIAHNFIRRPYIRITVVADRANQDSGKGCSSYPIRDYGQGMLG